MDKQTAIDLLDNLIGMVEDNHESDYDTAIKMGIDALKMQLSEEGATKSTTFDYIDRQAAIGALDALCDRECEYSKQQRSFMCGACRLGSAFDVIDELPSVQPKDHECWGCNCEKVNAIQPEEVARDIATIIENEKDMRVIRKNAQPQRWIPVTEALPEKDGQYVVCSDGYVFPAIYHQKGVYDGNVVWMDYHWTDLETGIIQQIEAWMPLPEPWRGGQDE